MTVVGNRSPFNSLALFLRSWAEANAFVPKHRHVLDAPWLKHLGSGSPKVVDVAHCAALYTVTSKNEYFHLIDGDLLEETAVPATFPSD